MRVVAALGGNALLERGERPDSDVQESHVASAAAALKPLLHEARCGHHARQRPAGRAAGRVGRSLHRTRQCAASQSRHQIGLSRLLTSQYGTIGPAWRSRLLRL
jgi:carbamate kinase